MTYKVTQMIVRRDATPIEQADPKPVTFYRGDSLAQAMSAMTTAAADIERDSHDQYVLYTVIGVTLEVVGV